MNMLVEGFEDPIAAHAHALLAEVGEDPRRAGLADTPERFAKALRSLTSGYESDLESVVGRGVFDAENGDASAEATVIVRDIEFYSLCEHHMLPFFGRVHVAYVPAKRIIGLSKVPRIVELYARRLQVQERLTQQIADALEKVLEPKGVLVLAEARHLCMAMRGVRTQNSVTTTRALRGAFVQDGQARMEALSMIKEHRA